MTDRKEDTRRTAKHSRVLLYAPCYLDAEAAMSLATELARQIGAELHGVLVQDKCAMPASGGMVSAVVSYSGVQAAGVNADAMQSAFRADARRFRDSLLRRAQEATLRAVFQEVEGHLAETMQKTAKSGDLLVIGYKPIFRRKDDLVVVMDKGRTPPEFAEPLARRLHKRLLAFQSDERPGALIAELERMSPAAVILAGAQTGLPLLARIVEAARCPVIVVQSPQ